MEEERKLKIVNDLHGMDHSGKQSIKKRLRENYYFKSAAKYIDDCIAKCPTCRGKATGQVCNFPVVSST